jgi:hypothetical protein
MSIRVRIAVGLVSFFGFVLVVVLLFYAIAPWTEETVIPFSGSRLRDTASFGVSALVSLFATIRFIQGKRWAWWGAAVITVITFALAVLLGYSDLHPRDAFAASEAGFGLFLALILAIPSVVSGVLLALPSVRRAFLS